MREILDSAVLRQFSDFVSRTSNKTLDDLLGLPEELEEEGKRYLREMYPGSTKSPDKMVELMTSENVDGTVMSSEVINQGHSCPFYKRLLFSCPPGWIRDSSDRCIFMAEEKMNMEQAVEHCRSRGAKVFSFEETQNRVDFHRLLKKGQKRC